MTIKKGFTLLEVLLSSLIFAIVIMTVLGTYSMLISNYRQARNYIEATTRAHNIFIHFRGNISNVYPEYENEQEQMMEILFRRIEDDYNLPRSEIGEQFIWDLQHSHRYEEESVYGFANQQFPDFSFVVNKHAQNSLLSFSVYNKALISPLDLGMQRLTYFVEDGILYCYKQPLFMSFEEVVKNHFRQASQIKQEELLPIADGIINFQVFARYYRDHDFKYADTWNSNANQHVFPPLLEEKMIELTPQDERLLFPERDGHPVGLTISFRLALGPNDEEGRLYKMYYDLPVSISSWFEDQYRYEYRYETPYY